jgi:hypothetical protein
MLPMTTVVGVPPFRSPGSAARQVFQLSVAPLRCSNAMTDAVMGTIEKALTIAGLTRV